MLVSLCYPGSIVFTYDYACLPIFNRVTYVHSSLPVFALVYLCVITTDFSCLATFTTLLVLLCLCLPIFTRDYQYLNFFTYVCHCLLYVYPFLLEFTNVFSCFPIFTTVYLCLPRLTIVHLRMFTYVYQSLLVFTYVYNCLLVFT